MEKCNKSVSVLDLKKTAIIVLALLYFIYIVMNLGSAILLFDDFLSQISLYVFFIGVIFTSFFTKINYANIKVFIYWYVPFYFICLLSMLYSVDFNVSSQMFLSLTMVLIFGVCFSALVSFKDGYRYIKLVHIFSSIIMGTYLIHNFSQIAWWSRLGEEYGINSNLLSLYFVIPICFAITEISNRSNIFISFLSLIVSLYTVLLTGSKKGLFCVVVFVIVYYLCKAQSIGKKIKYCFIITIGIFTILLLIMNNETLYNVLGYRIETMINTFLFLNHVSVAESASTADRIDMIKYGLKFFGSQPIFGNGINAFRFLYASEVGRNTYAHNNFIELLADVGIIGFVAYYRIHLKIIRTIIKNTSKNSSFAEMAAYIAMLIVNDISVPTYFDTKATTIIIIVIYLFSSNFVKTDYGYFK